MTRTSKALRRLGVGLVAAATVLSVAPALGATAALAAGTPLLVANDCTQQSTGTTTTTTANTNGPTTPGNPSNATGAGSGCTTQAQVNTNKTLTFTYTEGGTPVAGRSLDFTITNNATPGCPCPPGTPAVQPTSSFSAQQPAGTTSFAGPAPTNFAGQGAQCTTDANGQCSVNVTDSKAETITVNATERATGAKAYENVEFRPNPTNVTRLNEVARTVVAPENAPSTTTGAPGTTQFPGTNAVATPGRPVQLTYTAYDQNGTGTGSCASAQAPAGSATCTGAIVRSQTIALKVDNAAYFTPNCTPQDVANAPLRNAGPPAGGGAPSPTTPAVAAAGTTPAQPSTGTLAPPNYANCAFTGTPADDAMTTPLTTQGQTLTVVTDQNGQFTVTVAEGRDPIFDRNGLVEINLTATPAGGTTALTPRTPGTGAPTGTTCQTVNPAGTVSGAGTNGTGCNVLPIEFSTRYPALNGSAVSIDPISGPAYQASNPTPDNPGTQAPIFVVHLRDQYGNLTQADGTGQTPNNVATLTKTGSGTLVPCGSGPFNAGAPCGGAGGSVGTPTNGTTAQDGTTIESFYVKGSYLNNDGNQERFTVAPSRDVNGNAVDGTATVTAKWVAPVTEYVVGTTTDAATGIKTSGFDQSETDNVLTNVVAFAFYHQQAKNITFTTTPGSTVPVGTVVTVNANVTDQNGKPLQGYPVTFFRGGSSNNCTNTAANGTGQNGNGTTDNLGNASYSFSCAEASTQNVTLVVYDRNNTGCVGPFIICGPPTTGQGAEIGRNTVTITFTGASVSPTSSATPTATASSTTTPTPSNTASPGTTKLTLTTSTPDIQPNEPGILDASGSPNTTFVLRCYTRPNTTYFDARSVPSATGSVQFRIYPGENTRCFVKYAGRADNDALNSTSLVINVHATLSLSTVRNGTRNYTFQGRNLPRLAGQLITLYRVDHNGKEIRTSNLTTDSSGIYRVTRQFTGTGTFEFLVRTSQTLNNAAGKSNVITVNVR